jgi:uncharacterized integral membrane protein
MANWLRNTLKLLLIVPLAVIFLSFDLANRQNVVISFDPFNSTDVPLPTVELPLFIVLIGAVILGVLLGGIAVWARQGRFRKQLRENKVRLDKVLAENDALRTRLGEGKPATTSFSTVGTAVATRSAA